MTISNTEDVFAINFAKNIIEKESKVLTILRDSISSVFSDAVQHILTCQGKVAVTGMGKSGHIGRKIASTLASTGTPAYFIHPAEASHGDMGMMQNDDILLAISTSGESAELVDILNFAHRNNMYIIAITKQVHSTLAKNADQCLLLPDAEEACPIGCAPTTSSIATLALGDALAMTLLAARGFSSGDFNALHPGGALGKKLMLVRQILHAGESMPLVREFTEVSDVLLCMTGKGFGCAGVIDASGKLIGIITDGDLRRHLGDGLLMAKAADIMSPNPMSATPDMPVSKAVRIMNEKTITCLFIVENNIPVGIIHMHDCLRAGH